MKLLNIAIKDLLLTLNDRAALIFMLLAPLLLTLGMGMVTGAFSSQDAGLQDIPVAIYDQDQGAASRVFLEAFNSEQLQVLFEPVEVGSEAEARQAVTDDKAAAAIIIPPGFSDSLLPDRQSGQRGPLVKVELHANPARPISARIVRSVTAAIINRVDSLALGGEVAVGQLLASGRIGLGDVETQAEAMALRLAELGKSGQPIGLHILESAPPQENSFIALMAPGMALFFLMYTVTQGGRSILAERDMGTLPRMLTTPSHYGEVLGGKVLSVFVTGFLQVGMLIAATSLIFNLRWGNPLAVILVTAAAAFAATGWGILLAALAQTPFQVSSIGSALMLLFGLLGGTFIPVEQLSPLMRLVGKATPNAWALDGFRLLATGGGLGQILDTLAGLIAMGLLLFAISILAARSRWAAGFIR